MYVSVHAAYGRSSLTNEKDHRYFLNKVHVCWRLTRPILALNCRLQEEQVRVVEPAGGPLVLTLHSLRFFFSALQILFFSQRAAPSFMRPRH